MSKPFLYLLHWHSVRYEQRCAAVTQIVESYPSQPLLLKKLRELCCEIHGLYQITDLIYADISIFVDFGIGSISTSLRLAGNGGVAIDNGKCVRCGKCAEACPALAMEYIGMKMTVDELLEEVVKDEPFYEQSHGGVSLSGGEPLAQAAFAEEFLKACKGKAYHTAVGTCGFVPQQAVEAVLPYLLSILSKSKLTPN